MAQTIEGFNNKWRPSGSGTTSSSRKEKRASKQWSFLDNPSGKKCLEKHLESLEKARAKCLDKLQHAEEEEALEKAEKAHKKAMKKQKKALGKEKASLEKEDVAMEGVKIDEESLQKGKPGKERQLKAKLHESLEKARADAAAAAGGTASSSSTRSHAEHASDFPAEPNLGKGKESPGKGKDKGGHPHLCGLAQHLGKG